MHADILPTLLDAMGAPFDPHQFQGESALRGIPARNFIFTYGNENTSAAVEKIAKSVFVTHAEKLSQFRSVARPG